MTLNATSDLVLSLPNKERLEADNLNIVVKSEGSWSQKLYEELSSVNHLEVSVEGPYGPSSSHFLRSAVKHFFLVRSFYI